MTNLVERPNRVVELLDRPLSGLYCVLSWVGATVVFIGLVALLGGPTQADASESFYSTWAIAHGNFACAYPPVTPQRVLPDYQPLAHIPPFWPLFSGAVSALMRIGHSVPFPSGQSFGHQCGAAYSVMYLWAGKTFAVIPTIGVGYLSWFFLLAGIVACLRASGRGRCGWEAVAVVVVAVIPIMWMPLIILFHPQDLVTVGLLLGGLACGRRNAWVWTGILFGLAVSSQQFALLVLAPLVFVAPAEGRLRLIVSSSLTWLVVVIPIVIVTSGQAWNATLIGSGDFRSYGGTLLWELNLHGASLDFLSRIAPILVAALIGWYVHKRLGPKAMEATPLIAVSATCVSMRLVFEQNLFGYYFMALAVLLVILDVTRRRIRGELIVWLVAVCLAFNPIPAGLDYNARSWSDHVATGFPAACLVIALAVIVWDAFYRRIRWYLLVSFGVAVLAFANWPPWDINSLRAPMPIWLRQIVLVGGGVALALGPLISAVWQPENLTQEHGTVGEAVA
jgi:hypothetical protein